MKKMILLVSGKANFDKDTQIINWSKREIPQGQISLTQELDCRLLEIRAEHMRWAYETGNRELTESQSLAQLLECGSSPSMWWTSLIYERHPKLSPNLYIIYKLRCLEHLIEENKCQSLELVGGNKILTQILADMCKASGLNFISTNATFPQTSSKSLKEKIYSLLPASLRAIIRFCHWFWTIKRRLPFAVLFGKEQQITKNLLTATIVTYFPNIDLHAAGEGHFHSRYWESLHHALNEEARRENPHGPHFVRWLFIRFPSPELTFTQCLKLRDIFQKKGEDGLSFNYLEEFLNFHDLGTSIKRWRQICKNSNNIKKEFAKVCYFSGSKLNFWPLMKEQWAESFCGWRCLERCLQNQAFIRFTKMAGPQRWNLFPLENCPWERMFTEAARKNRCGEVFGAQHSIIRPTDFRYFDDPRTFSSPQCSIFQPDVIAGNGHSACSQWLTNKMPKSRLIQVEALRYLYLAKQMNMPQEKQTIPSEPGEPLYNTADLRLLVLTSFFEDETLAHLDLLGKALDSGLLADWKIFIKPHPYLPVSDWINARPKEQKEQISQVAGPMSLALAPGINVWASNSTTASLEAAIKKLPLMVMLPVDDFDLCPIQNVPGLLRSGTLDDVANGLKNMRPLPLGPDYLCLDASLSAWRKLLGLSAN